MHERGRRFTDGISILVSSAVPEGKGVSSSAAVEVSIMQALSAAHGVQLEGRELAMLCQKVGALYSPRLGVSDLPDKCTFALCICKTLMLAAYTARSTRTEFFWSFAIRRMPLMVAQPGTIYL
jgi:hypothetical protein